MFPMAQFDEKALFTQITSVIAQMENWMVFVNDLMSFYKEFDDPRDQTSLVNNYVRCDHITLDQALDKLTRDTIVCSEQLIAVFKDKDPKIIDTLLSFCQGYVTWHLSDPRYRLKELYERAGNSPAGLKFREYQQASSAVAALDPREWAYPSVAVLAEQQKMASTASDDVGSLKLHTESISGETSSDDKKCDGGILSAASSMFSGAILNRWTMSCASPVSLPQSPPASSCT